jgi:CHAD domain-containing protein
VISAAQALRGSVRRLDEALEPLTRRASIGGVHAARAAARKVVDTLRTFGVALPVLDEVAGLLKDALGDVRDLHVSGVRKGPKLSRATAQLRRTMADWKCARKLIDRELAHVVVDASAKQLLHRRLRKLEQRIEALPARAPPRQAHRLRVKAKRARTAVALVAPSDKRLLKKLKKATATLGVLHDLDAGLLHEGPPRKELVREVAPALAKLHDAL